MKNSIKHQILLLAITGIAFTFLFVSSCKNPIDTFKDFQLNLSGNLAKTNFYVKFSSNDSIIGALPKNVTVNVTGKDSKFLFDENGNKDFKIIDGRVNFIISNEAKIDLENPLIFTIEAYCPNTLPIKEQIFVFDRNAQTQFTFYFQSILNPTDGSKVITQSLNFLGKKATDTLTCTGSANGISFKYTFPKKGVYFWRKYQEKYIDGIDEIVRDTIREATITQTYNGQTQTRTQRVASGGNIVRIKVDTIYKYNYITIFDTVSLNDINAVVTIKPQGKTIQNCMFYDNNTGEYFAKPYYFRNTTEVSLDFKNNAGDILQIFYPYGSYNVEFTSGNFKDNSNIIVSGTNFNTTSGYFNTVNQIVHKDQYKIDDNNGQKRIKFDCNLIGGKITIFEDKVVGCRYSNVVINSSLRGAEGFYFNTQIDVKEPGNPNPILSYSLRSAESSKYTNTDLLSSGLTLPGFENYQYSLTSSVDHYENLASGNYNKPLYTQTTLVNDICNYSTTNPKVVYINYNSPYNDFVWVDVNANIVCSGGNTVLPSVNLFFVRKNAKDASIPSKNVINSFWYYGQMILSNGSLKTKRLRKNQEYFIFAVNNDGFRWGETISLDPAQTSQVLEDADGYFKGTLNYNAANDRFSLNIDFDNKKMKYKINGCGY